jgi:hypothetical protein
MRRSMQADTGTDKTHHAHVQLLLLKREARTVTSAMCKKNLKRIILVGTSAATN